MQNDDDKGQESTSRQGDSSSDGWGGNGSTNGDRIGRAVRGNAEAVLNLHKGATNLSSKVTAAR